MLEIKLKNIKWRHFQVALAAWIICFVAVVPSIAAKNKNSDIFLKAEVSEKNPYEGEAVRITYNLYSKTADIGYAQRNEEFKISGDYPDSFISPLQIDQQGRRVMVEGEEYVVFPLESYIVSLDKKGNYSYTGGTFEIGVNYPVVYNDPFWGKRRGYKTEKIFLDAPDVSLKVKKIPDSKSDDDESTSVGSYSISAMVPPGDIILDNPARVVITLKGHGLLGKDVLPQYADAFNGEDVRLKSMSENRKTYFDGRNVVSELTLDCEFIPLAKEVVIAPVSFRFFNPETGKYEETHSSPVTVKVKSITTKVETVDI